MTKPGRDYPPRPIVGVGAVIFRGGEVLLVQRGHEPSAGRGSIPGGGGRRGGTGGRPPGHHRGCGASRRRGLSQGGSYTAWPATRAPAATPTGFPARTGVGTAKA